MKLKYIAMKNTFLLLLLMLPLAMPAQMAGADAWLDKVVASMKADAALQMDYTFTVYDEDNSITQSDKGVMKLDGDRYALLMDEMKVWCNGTVRWSYMKGIDEIYITDASAGDAQYLSPLYVVEKFRAGCTKSLQMQGDTAVVELNTNADDGIEKVKLYIDCTKNRLNAMTVFVALQGRVEVVLDKYTAGCNFPAESYECPVKDFPEAEVVDMR